MDQDPFVSQVLYGCRRLCETKQTRSYLPSSHHIIHGQTTDTMQIFCSRLIPWRMQIASSSNDMNIN